MATGKTHARWLRLIMDTVDLSGDSRQIGSFGSTYDTADQFGWSDGVHNFNLGHGNHVFTGYQAVFNNTATTGSHIELSAREEYIITLFIGIKAAPANGNPCWMSTMEQVTYDVDGSGPVIVSVDTAKSTTTIDQEQCWGVVHDYATEFTATTNGTSIDNGASSANGALGHVHVTVSDGGTWTIKHQDSDNDVAWADLITYSADGSAVAAESGTASGTVDRYTRSQMTRVGGTCTASFALARQ